MDMASLPEHDHCKNCGDPIPFDMAFCREDCYWEYQRKKRKEKEKWAVYAAVLAITVAVLLVFKILA